MGGGAAEVLFENGHILTGCGQHLHDPDVTPQVVEALAVRGGLVVAAGSRDAVKQYADGRTERIDLQGAFAMPGFNDAHLHLGLAGQQRRALDLAGTASLGALLAALERYRAQTTDDPWLLGGGWDETGWPEGRLPTRHDLDRVTGDTPAVLRRVDVHIAVANSAALAAAGISAGTGEPAGARIDRDAQGRPTGVLREAAAMNLVYNSVPPLSVAQRREGLRLAMQEAVAHGVTSVQDNSDWEDFPVLQAMRQEGDVPLRVAEWMEFDRPSDELEERRRSHPVSDSWLHLTQLKGFLDGSLGSRTAAMLEDYSDDPGNLGLPRYEQEELLRLTRERLHRGFSIAFHAIGDRANRMALDVFEACDLPSHQGLRCRIEHAQVVTARDMERFGKLGVIASVQPCHLLGDMPWAAERLGAGRVGDAYRLRSFARAGVCLAFGTDLPVESVDPWRGLYSAVSRRPIEGGQAWEEGERLTLAEAIRTYTEGGAFAEFRERGKGRLAPGMVADIVVLDRNPFIVPPEEWRHLQVLRTVVGGRTVFGADGVAASGPPEGHGR